MAATKRAVTARLFCDAHHRMTDFSTVLAEVGQYFDTLVSAVAKIIVFMTLTNNS